MCFCAAAKKTTRHNNTLQAAALDTEQGKYRNQSQIIPKLFRAAVGSTVNRLLLLLLQCCNDTNNTQQISLLHTIYLIDIINTKLNKDAVFTSIFAGGFAFAGRLACSTLLTRMNAHHSNRSEPVWLPTSDALSPGLPSSPSSLYVVPIGGSLSKSSKARGC